jgi:DNA-binding NtrC family response regulator
LLIIQWRRDTRGGAVPGQVLLVVPDEDLRDALAIALQTDGYRVQPAPDAAHALVRLLGTPPDLLILDGTVADAAEVADWSERRSVPLVLLVPTWDAEAAPAYANAVVLPMPFGLAQFREVLNAAIPMQAG